MEIKTLNDFLTAYTSAAKGSAERKSVAEEIWYDWFCSDSSLERRTKKFIRPLKELVKAVPEAGLLTRVSAKNNCPIDGPTYDVLRLFGLDDEFVVLLSFDCCNDDHRFAVEDRETVNICSDDRDEAIAKFIEVTRKYLTLRGLI